MLPSIREQVEGYARQVEKDAAREQPKKKVSTGAGKPRVRVDLVAVREATMRNLAGMEGRDIRAADIVLALPRSAQGDSYRYMTDLLDRGLLVKSRRGLYLVAKT